MTIETKKTFAKLKLIKNWFQSVNEDDMNIKNGPDTK